MKIGYDRASTTDLSLDTQTDSLSEAGCEKLFTDVASGARTQRQGLDKAILFCQMGDILLFWKLDRVGPSMPRLIEMIQKLEKRGRVSIPKGKNLYDCGRRPLNFSYVWSVG